MAKKRGSQCSGKVTEVLESGCVVRLDCGPEQLRGVFVEISNDRCADVTFEGKRGRKINWRAPGSGDPNVAVGDEVTCSVISRDGAPQVNLWFNASTHGTGGRRSSAERFYAESGMHR